MFEKLLENKKLTITILVIFVLSISLYYFLYFIRGTLVIDSGYENAQYYVEDKEIKNKAASFWTGKYVLRVEAEDKEDTYYNFTIEWFKKTVVAIDILIQKDAHLDENIYDESLQKYNLSLKTPSKESFGTIYYDRYMDIFNISLSSPAQEDGAKRWMKENGIKENEYIIQRPSGLNTDYDLP